MKNSKFLKENDDFQEKLKNTLGKLKNKKTKKKLQTMEPQPSLVVSGILFFVFFEFH